MRKRCRVVTSYYTLLPVTSAAELADVPAAVAVDQLIAGGALIFRDPQDSDYLMVVQPSGRDILGDSESDVATSLEEMLSLPDTLLDVTPAPEEAVLADEEGWEIVFSRMQPDEQLDAVLAGLVMVAPDLTNLPLDANPDVARQIFELGGSIYCDADNSDDDDDLQAEDISLLPAAWLNDGLNAALDDPQDGGDRSSGYVHIVIPAVTPRIQFGRLTRLADQLAPSGIGYNYEEFEDKRGDYHISYLIAI